jgi:hypothetical protein
MSPKVQALLTKYEIGGNSVPVIPAAKRSAFVETIITQEGTDNLIGDSFVIERLGIARGNSSLLCASSGSGKSFFLQYLASCVQSGMPLFGEFPVMQGSVVHIDQEQSTRQTKERYERIWKGSNMSNMRVRTLKLAMYKMDDPQVRDSIKQDMLDICEGQTLVIMDSLKALSGVDENSADIRWILDVLKEVAGESNCAIVIIHHMGKTPGSARTSARGHSAIMDAIDVKIDLEGGIGVKGYNLTCSKNRDGVAFDPLSYDIIDIGAPMKHKPKTTEGLQFLLKSYNAPVKQTMQTRILSELESGPSPMTALQKAIGGEKKIFYKEIDEMKEAGFITVEEGAGKTRTTKLVSITLAGKEKLVLNTTTGWDCE